MPWSEQTDSAKLLMMDRLTVTFKLCHIADLLLQIKYKKFEPLADRLQVRISRVWWRKAHLFF